MELKSNDIHKLIRAVPSWRRLLRGLSEGGGKSREAWKSAMKF
jgi:hypothetical protein